MHPNPDLDLVVVGGCGHVGLPLAMSFADVGCRVGIYDTDDDKIMYVRRGQMPFRERGADELLAKTLATGRLELSNQAEMVERTRVVVMVIGTPIDEFMNPSTRVFERVVDEVGPRLRPHALVVLRSTVYPGTTAFVRHSLKQRSADVEVAFCPERVAEGYALEEIRTLPQIIGADDDAAFDRASALFEKFDVEIIRTTSEEAELAKLLTNTWRYMKFAIANQFFQIVHRAGQDHSRVLHAIRHNYPRAADLPGPGFAAGPCLLKDVMQLAAFTPDNFPMGHSAMLINEGLPGYVIGMLDHRRPLKGRTVGILGMAFKGESDDVRSSLSYKLKKLAGFKGARVLCHDPYVLDPDLHPLETVLGQSDVLIVAAPHKMYRQLAFDGREVVDIWAFLGSTIRL
jgi:UDP-N-acetyl-D-mannosaminuronic acid dehydrogenase